MLLIIKFYGKLVELRGWFMDKLVQIVIYFSVILLIAMYTVIVFGQKTHIVVIAIIGFALGLIFGVGINGIPSGLLSGSFM
jgi:hypothetical protein